MSSDRDTLAALLAHARRGVTAKVNDNDRAQAAAAIEAGWRPPARVIKTVAELDALQTATEISRHFEEHGRTPEGVVIRTAEGRVLQRDVDNSELELAEHLHAGWWLVGSDADDIDSVELSFPVTVLLEPKAGDQ